MVECGSCGETYPRKKYSGCPKCSSKSVNMKLSAHKECEECGARNNLDSYACVKCDSSI